MTEPKNELENAAAGLTATVIKPLIERQTQKLRHKLSEADLSKRTNRLTQEMERYLIHLSNQVSEITSIAFPQANLKLIDSYEPLKLIKHASLPQNEDQKVPVESLTHLPKGAITIIDSAGMGKSTFSKFLVHEILFKQEKIPVLFELRKLHGETTLIEGLASELDTPSQKFDRALFNKALDEGKLYLILDGFDEVEIQRQKDLANEITDLSSKCHKNTIIITSRPQETLPKLSHGVSVQFDYFTRTQAISLLERYDKIAKLDIGKRLIREIDSVPERFIESPLLVSLLYRTFGVNNSIATQIITFYDEIYDALYKGHDLINKNGYAREKLSGLNFEEFRIFLRSLCYYMMLKRKTTFANSSEAFNYINFAIELSGVSPTSPQNFLQDLLVCVPLMQRDGVEIKFIHKTIIEYFAAEHIVYDKNSEELLRKLFLSSISAGLDQTFDFIYEMNRDLFNHVITSHFASQAPLDQLETANELKRSLTTLTFLKRCKVGIWDKDKYSQPRPGGRRQKIFSFEKAGEKHDEFMSFVWDETTISRHEYYIVFALGDTPDNFHERAWESIKEDYPGFTKSNPNEFSADCANQLSQIIKKDQWHDLTPDLINKISTLGYKDSILDLAETSITSNRLGRSLKPGVLSAKKIKLLLSRASRQNQIAKELDGLIN